MITIKLIFLQDSRKIQVVILQVNNMLCGLYFIGLLSRNVEVPYEDFEIIFFVKYCF